ncbi:cell wall hydrolase [Sphingomicrobium sediminis]|uniref:Cell wall hydrolase n=1 Tax=Sphingomicrobium sediminis TaxID=2950949 RepID=A0A9X2EL60_9SPHN|nr:cell wall hydrolase [Sphingomicrobium sediminis]MCM8557447.1 cell wall hydrolase [Sphingomicrobium sediminis]
MKRILGAGLAPVMGFALLVTAGGSEAVGATIDKFSFTEEQKVAGWAIEAAAVEETEEAHEEDKTLPELVAENRGIADSELSAQEWCLANAVYFEARNQDLEGQLAVADVVMNRTDSDQYPDNWCDVIKQKAQFSFVTNRKFPKITEGKSWDTAKAVAQVAIDESHDIVRGDVLWYHADYVKPVWRHNLDRVAKVGVHIFYEA